jgi:hypothetical protein
MNFGIEMFNEPFVEYQVIGNTIAREFIDAPP